MRPKGSADLLSDRRRRALKLLDEDLSLNEVARRVGCAGAIRQQHQLFFYAILSGEGLARDQS
jgi:hypothetical protein